MPVARRQGVPHTDSKGGSFRGLNLSEPRTRRLGEKGKGDGDTLFPQHGGEQQPAQAHDT